jgi:hypothetical protein
MIQRQGFPPERVETSSASDRNFSSRPHNPPRPTTPPPHHREATASRQTMKQPELRHRMFIHGRRTRPSRPDASMRTEKPAHALLCIECEQRDFVPFHLHSATEAPRHAQELFPEVKVSAKMHEGVSNRRITREIFAARDKIFPARIARDRLCLKKPPGNVS